MIFLADYLNGLCNRPGDFDMYTSFNYVENNIDELKKDYTVLPRPLVMLKIGTKEYTRDFRDIMLPNTLFFPDELEHIRNLEDGEYVIKRGFSGSSQGNQYMSKNAMIKQFDKTKAWLDAGKYDPKASCATPFRIVQKKTELFSNCHEIRFFVIGSVLRGFATLSQSVFGSINHFGMHPDDLNKIYGKRLNTKIYKFVMDIANRCNKLWDDNLVLYLE